MADETINNLVAAVQEMFRDSCPNGSKLGWDRNRFFYCLVNLCTDCKVMNCTDFNYSYCNSFEIEPNIGWQEHSYVLTFKISFVSDVYSLHVTKYSKDRKTGKVVEESECAALIPTIAVVRQFAANSEFLEMQVKDHDVIVAEVLLELSDIATLGKCLFDDYE